VDSPRHYTSSCKHVHIVCPTKWSSEFDLIIYGKLKKINSYISITWLKSSTWFLTIMQSKLKPWEQHMLKTCCIATPFCWAYNMNMFTGGSIMSWRIHLLSLGKYRSNSFQRKFSILFKLRMNKICIMKMNKVIPSYQPFHYRISHLKSSASFELWLLYTKIMSLVIYEINNQTLTNNGIA
jgi:hypothetical protein